MNDIRYVVSLTRSIRTGKWFVYLMYFCFANNCAWAANIDPTWLNLLHVDGGRSEVESGRFFVSDTRKPEDEYKILVAHLRSPSGFNFACQFPARYSYLLLQGMVPAFDLSKCEELVSFEDSFQSKNLSLAMAAEYPKSPASSFGHIMLVFHDDKLPQKDADAVHFAAVTPEHPGFLRYIADGIFGNFNGYFFREPLFKKIAEYSDQEQRYVFFFHLKTSAEQRKRLIYHLYELRDKNFKYYFIKNNCAFRIQTLLNVTFARKPTARTFYTLPIDVVLNFNDDIVDVSVEQPLVERAKAEIQNLNDQQRILFKNANAEGRFPEGSDNSVFRAVNLYQQYLFRSGGRSSVAYNELVSQFYEPSDLKVETTMSPMERPRSKRIQIGLQRSKTGGKESLAVGFRPLLVDRLDNQKNFGESEQTVFDSSITVSKNRVNLRGFNFINYRVMPVYSEFFKDYSWQLYSGLNRENDRKTIAWSNAMGMGQTFRPISSLTLNYILAVCADADFRTFQLSACPTLAAFQYLGHRTKLSYHLTHKEFFPRNFRKHEVNLIRNWKRKSFYLRIIKLQNFDETYGAGMNYYL